MDSESNSVEESNLAKDISLLPININDEKKSPNDIVDEGDDDQCAVCLDGTTYDDNCILYCDKCNVAVHQTCYGVDEIPAGAWFCDVCAAGGSPEITTCQLCSNTGGAYKACDKAKSWVHVLCALWIPEVYQAETGVYNISNIDKSRYKMRCRLCNTKGAIVQCAYGRCTSAVHAWCALKGNKGYTHRIVKCPDTPGLCYWEIFCAAHADSVKDPVKPRPKSKRIHFLDNDEAEKPEKPSKSDKPVKRRGPKKKIEDASECSDEEVPAVHDADGYLDTSLFADDAITREVAEAAPHAPSGHAMYTFSEWPGQAEGEAMDLFHFWNIVSMHYPEDYSQEWILNMAEPFTDASRHPITGFETTLTARPALGSIEDTMKLLQSANDQVLSIGASLTDREKVFLFDNNKRLQFCGQILRSIDRIQNHARCTSPLIEANDSNEGDQYDSRSEMDVQEEGATVTCAAISDIEAQVYLDYASFLTAEEKSSADYVSKIISVNSSIMSTVYNTTHGRILAMYQLHHSATEGSSDSIDLSSKSPGDLWSMLGILGPANDTSVNVNVSGSATADLISVEPYDINKPVHLPDKTVIPRNDEDDLCYIARSEQALLRRLWNTISTRVSSLYESALQLQEDATKRLPIHPDEYDAIETAYLKQRAWKRITEGVIRGMKDQTPDFNRPTEDSLPASWTIQVQGRPKPEEEEEEEQEDAVCMVCFDGSSSDGNRILFCDGCNAAMHQTCYGIAEIPEGDFYCERCCRVRRLAEASRLDHGEDVRDAVTCCLCAQHHGGLKATTSHGQWVHLCCALWAPQCVIGNICEMTAIDIRDVPVMINVKRRRNEYLETIRLEDKINTPSEMAPKEDRGSPHTCIYCNQTMGYAVFCGHEEDGLCCTASFHPLCAWFRGAHISADNKDPTYLLEPYPSSLSYTYRCVEHSAVDRMSREEQKKLRMKYHINENDLCVIPGFQKKRKHRKKNKAATNTPKVKELNIDKYDDDLCCSCMHPINHALTSIPLPSVTCSQCKLTVHAKCAPGANDPWICAQCTEGELQCAFCPRRGGIFSRTSEEKWAHTFCATYKVGFHRSDLKKEKKVSCSFCNRRSGNIVNCRQTGCTQSFHPLCAARSQCVYFQVQHGNKQAYCLEHIPNTVIRIPSGHWVNIEEVRRLRQSLDMARVILDRMQKREKLKRSYYKSKGDSVALIANSLLRRLMKRLGGDIDTEETPEVCLEELLSEPEEEELEPTPKKRGQKPKLSNKGAHQPMFLEDDIDFADESFMEEDFTDDLGDISSTWLNSKGKLSIPKHVYVAFSGQEVCINSRKMGRLPSLQDYAKNVRNDILKTVEATRSDFSIFSSQRSFSEFDRKLGPWLDHFLSRSVEDLEANANNPNIVELEHELTLETKRSRPGRVDSVPPVVQAFKVTQPVHRNAKEDLFTLLFNRLEDTPAISVVTHDLPKDEYNDKICSGATLLALERNIFHVLNFLSMYEISLSDFRKYEYHVTACYEHIATKLFNAARRKPMSTADAFLLSDEFQAIPYEEMPNYETLVTTPLTFPILREKLQNHKYTSFGAFASDFYLMLSNARHVTEPATSTWWCSELLAMLFKLLNMKLKSLTDSTECLFYTISGQWVVMEPSVYYATMALAQQNIWSQPCPTCNHTFEYPLVDAVAKAAFNEEWKCICPACLDAIRHDMRNLDVQIYWADDKEYYGGTVADFDAVSGEHSVLYLDDQVEFVRIGAEPYLLHMPQLLNRHLFSTIYTTQTSEKKIKKEAKVEVKMEDAKTPKKNSSQIGPLGKRDVKLETPVPTTSIGEKSSKKRRADAPNSIEAAPSSKKKKVAESPMVETPRSLRKK